MWHLCVAPLSREFATLTVRAPLDPAPPAVAPPAASCPVCYEDYEDPFPRPAVCAPTPQTDRQFYLQLQPRGERLVYPESSRVATWVENRAEVVSMRVRIKGVIGAGVSGSKGERPGTVNVQRVAAAVSRT